LNISRKNFASRKCCHHKIASLGFCVCTFKKINKRGEGRVEGGEEGVGRERERDMPAESATVIVYCHSPTTKGVSRHKNDPGANCTSLSVPPTKA